MEDPGRPSRENRRDSSNSVTILKQCCILPQRYVLCIMGFLAILTAYLMRLCLSMAITEMVIPIPNEIFHDPDDYCPIEKPQGRSGIRNNSLFGSPFHLNSAEYYYKIIVLYFLDGVLNGFDFLDNILCLFLGILLPTRSLKWRENTDLFDWDEKTQGVILSSFYWGYAMTHIPGGILADKFGGKHTLGFGMFLSSVFTMLAPSAARQGYEYLVLTRVITGLGEGTTFPALNEMLARWVPLQERGLLGSLAFSGSLIGSVAGTFLSGVILDFEKGNWPLVFYIFGGVGTIWCFLWLLLCYSTPETHPLIHESEKRFLLENVPQKQHGATPPWTLMLKSLPVWALLCAQIGHDWSFYTMVTDLPKYMKDVLRFSIRENSILSSVPYIFMWVSALGSGWFADWLIKGKYLTVTSTRKVFTAIAHFGPALTLVAATHAGCNRGFVVVLFTITMTFMGAFYPGMKINALDLSPNYAGSVMAIVNGTGALCGVFTPYLVGLLTPNRSLTEWRVVFYISALVNLATIVAFLLFGSGEVQPFNYAGFEEIPPEKKEKLDKSSQHSFNRGNTEQPPTKELDVKEDNSPFSHSNFEQPPNKETNDKEENAPFNRSNFEQPPNKESNDKEENPFYDRTNFENPTQRPNEKESRDETEPPNNDGFEYSSSKETKEDDKNGTQSLRRPSLENAPPKQKKNENADEGRQFNYD